MNFNEYVVPNRFFQNPLHAKEDAPSRPLGKPRPSHRRYSQGRLTSLVPCRPCSLLPGMRKLATILCWHYNDAMPVVEIENLEFSYRDYQNPQRTYCEPVLHGLSLSVHKGEHVMIYGEPEKGKTTLSRILTGSVPKYIDGRLSGRICVNGRIVGDVQTWNLVKDIAVIAQNSEEQLVCPTPEDEVAFPLQLMGMDTITMHRKVEAALDSHGLLKRKDSSSEALSGGEKKRLLLAVTEAVNPDIWLLDETPDELDEDGKRHLAEWIRTTDKTVVMLCSRPFDALAGVFDSYYILEGGMLTASSQVEVQDKARCGLPPLRESPVPVMDSGVKVIEASDVMIRKGSEFHVRVPRFRMQSGEIVALTGPNGSGKSSFARALCGLDDVLTGQFSLDKASRIVTLGYLFQNPDFQIFLPTVRDELSYPLAKGRDIDGACAEFGLEPDSVASILSYPERKKLQAAVYWLLDRPFYILDEMENSLSYENCHFIISKLRSRGAGILLITHDEVIASWAHRRYSISDSVMNEAREACGEL